MRSQVRLFSLSVCCGFAVFAVPTVGRATVCELPEVYLKHFHPESTLAQPHAWTFVFVPDGPAPNLICSYRSEVDSVAARYQVQPALLPSCNECGSMQLISFSPIGKLTEGVVYEAKCEVPADQSEVWSRAFMSEKGQWPTFRVGTKQASATSRIEVGKVEVERVRCGWRKVQTMLRFQVSGLAPGFWEDGGMIKVTHEDGVVDILQPAYPDAEPNTLYAVLPARGQHRLSLVAITGEGAQSSPAEIETKWWWPRRPCRTALD